MSFFYALSYINVDVLTAAVDEHYVCGDYEDLFKIVHNIYKSDIIWS